MKEKMESATKKMNQKNKDNKILSNNAANRITNKIKTIWIESKYILIASKYVKVNSNLYLKISKRRFENSRRSAPTITVYQLTEGIKITSFPELGGITKSLRPLRGSVFFVH